MTFYAKYLNECKRPTDIYEHLPKLYEIGCKCSSIVEFGVGFGVSTVAFLASLEQTGGSLDSYDIACLAGVSEKFATAKANNLNAIFHLQDTFEAKFDNTDMLFVDSMHTYRQVIGELTLHGHNVNKYIAFHDTISFGKHDEFGSGPGILPAIKEWMNQHPEFVEVYNVENCNGLLILERKLDEFS